MKAPIVRTNPIVRGYPADSGPGGGLWQRHLTDLALTEILRIDRQVKSQFRDAKRRVPTHQCQSTPLRRTRQGQSVNRAKRPSLSVELSGVGLADDAVRIVKTSSGESRAETWMVSVTVCFIWNSPLLDAGSRSASGSNRRMSPGWHDSAPKIALSVEKRIARALPVLRIERLASVILIRSASSVRGNPAGSSHYQEPTPKFETPPLDCPN